MAQITSREELEAWLKDKPTDWGQMIAVRAALTVLPRIPMSPKSDIWLSSILLDVFQYAFVAWASVNHPDLRLKTYFYNKDDPFFMYGPLYSALSYNSTYEIANAAFESIIYSADLINEHSEFSYEHVLKAVVIVVAAAAASKDVWEQVSADCIWLVDKDASSAPESGLVHSEFWPLQKSEWGSERLTFATNRILALDITYQVWIDWYNRRITGNRAAFDIPGDHDRTEDKAILARLADATNEDFWDKGATYVNTTLQSWIDEARERAAIEYVASGAPLNLGSEAELAARDELASRLASVEDALAALKDQLASLTQTGHGGIGHNQPENATSLRDDEIITLKQQVKELETLVAGTNAALTQPEPDIGELVQLVPKLNRWGRMMQAVEDVTSPKVREGLETWAGPAALGAVGYLASTTIPNALAAFSHYFYTYWIPLLIG